MPAASPGPSDCSGACETNTATGTRRRYGQRPGRLQTTLDALTVGGTELRPGVPPAAPTSWLTVGGTELRPGVPPAVPTSRLTVGGTELGPGVPPAAPPWPLESRLTVGGTELRPASLPLLHPVAGDKGPHHLPQCLSAT